VVLDKVSILVVATMGGGFGFLLSLLLPLLPPLLTPQLPPLLSPLLPLLQRADQGAMLYYGR
jgi:hypothetical protein